MTIVKDEKKCPICGGNLQFFDHTQRVVRSGGRNTRYIKIRRFKCRDCNRIHREIPDLIIPFKQYESEIIRGVKEGYITPDTLEYEDYPCITTMIRWSSQEIHFL